MARGGRRNGQAGKAYGNRTDLNKIKAPSLPKVGPSQQYGESARLQRDIRAVPMGPPPGSPQGGPPAGGAESPQSPMVSPGAFGPLDRASEMPGQPVQEGLPSGPGAGPEAMGLREGDDLRLQLQALYQAYPIQAIAELLEDME